MKEKIIPNFYSILPSSIRYDKKLSWFDKVLYSEITALTNYKGYCYAFNSYFENVFNVSQTTVSRSIKNLEQLKYISIEIIKSKNNQVLERRIYILGDKLYKKMDTPPIVKNDYYNNLKKNNTRFNKKNKRSSDVNPDWLESYIFEMENGKNKIVVRN